MKLFDVHCHLQDEQLIDSAKEIELAHLAGTERFLVNATCFDDWDRCLALSAEHEGVYAALGIHPWFIGCTPEEIRQKAAKYDFSSCRALGEIGLDSKRAGVPMETQIEVFNYFLSLSSDLNIPCSVHCSGAFAELTASLKKFAKLPPVVIHSFTGSAELAKSLSSFGCMFSAGSALTYPGRKKMKKLLDFIYPSLFMLETDSPASPPFGSSGINRPENIRIILKAAAELTGASEEETAEKTYSLSRAVFG